MLRSLTRATMALLLAGSSTHAWAQTAQWSLSEASGDVTLSRGNQRVKATRGMSLAAGDVVVTGVNGRAVLVHAKDFVTLAANSRVRLPAERKGSALTRFFQDMGNAIFRIEKLDRPHFAVDTPYLAAVVKGTTFSITVGAQATSLQVTEGLVEVATADGGARSLVRPGSIAMIAAGDRYRLSISGDQPRVIDSPQRPADQAPTASAAGGDTGGAAATPSAQPSVGSGIGATADRRSLDETGARPSADVVAVAVSSKPVDMGKLTGGILTGASPVAVIAAAVQPSRTPDDAKPVHDTPAPGKIPSGGGKPAESDQPDAGDKPGKGDAPGNGDKPDGADQPGGGETPGNGDKPGSDGKDDTGDKPGNGDKPDAGDKPGSDGKPDAGDKPGSDGKPDAGDKPGSDGKPDAGDKPGDGDKPDAGDKPASDGKPDASDKPASDGKPDASDKPASDGKPDAGDKPDSDGKPDAGDKPGNGDKPDAGDKPGSDGKPDAGDKPGDSDKPGTDDKPGKDNNPGKGGPGPIGAR